MENVCCPDICAGRAIIIIEYLNGWRDNTLIVLHPYTSPRMMMMTWMFRNTSWKTRKRRYVTFVIFSARASPLIAEVSVIMNGASSSSSPPPQRTTTTT